MVSPPESEPGCPFVLTPINVVATGPTGKSDGSLRICSIFSRLRPEIIYQIRYAYHRLALRQPPRVHSKSNSFFCGILGLSAQIGETKKPENSLVGQDGGFGYPTSGPIISH